MALEPITGNMKSIASDHEGKAILKVTGYTDISSLSLVYPYLFAIGQYIFFARLVSMCVYWCEAKRILDLRDISDL